MMDKKHRIKISAIICAVWMINSLVLYGQNLEENFISPPNSAKPKTWMHVMCGNMSKEGLTKDIEAIADAGIGGIFMFSVTSNIPNGPVEFNSPEHIALTAHAAAECERLGISFGIHNCDGWTSSGGPWVPVEHSMKQVVHREMVVEGGDINLRLPEPTKRGGFYQEIAVIAYPALASEIADGESQPVVTSSNPDFNSNIVSNGKLDERCALSVENGKKAWIQWDFGKPHTIQSFFLNTEKQRGSVSPILQSSNDGVNFKNEHELSILRQGKFEYGINKHFDAITARYFRFVAESAMDISEISLSSTYRFNEQISRISLHRIDNNRLPDLDEVPSNMAIKKEEIIHLTNDVDDKGVLKTRLPKGKWIIMRFGYTSTGAVNDPASIAGTGWEVDKMSRESFKVFYEGYVRNVIDASKKIAPNALQYVEIDSYEVGGQNWTKNYQNYFKENFGYDILDFLPLYAGRYIDNTETTDRILWDIRNFNSKLFCENYFDYFTELCHEDGLISYIEPYGNASFSTLDAARKVDIPMGEFHAHDKFMTGSAVSAGHIYGKNIISAEAFTAGGTGNFAEYPGSWKITGDMAWALGINEIVFHRFAHQANTKVKPGMGMSVWGSHIDRTQTWWENAGKDWFKYIKRGQYLLQQGIPVSDLLVFVGDGSPNNTASRLALKKLPNFINYDCVNADVLCNRISVEDGKLTLPEGTSYRALYLADVNEIHLSTLKQLAELADKGVIIIGKKPEKIGGYLVSVKENSDFTQLVNKIWSKPTTYSSINWEDLYTSNNIPVDLMIKGGEAINYAHRKTKTEDIYFFYNPDTIKHTYECTFNIDGKIPELWNQMNGEITRLNTFEHIDGKTKVAVTFDPFESGFIVFRESSKGINSITTTSAINNGNLSFKLKENGKSEVEAYENGSYEIEFIDGRKKQLEIDAIPTPVAIEGNWKVTFPDLKSGEQTFNFPKLIDWTTHDLEGIRYYSGTAIYETSFSLKDELLKNDFRISLDLGQVEVIARVILNGKDLGVDWMAPYVIDITSAVKAGENKLQIEVTNQWTNRLIGDENFRNTTGYDIRPQLNRPMNISNPRLSEINRDKMVDWYTNNEPAPLGERSTFTTYPFYKKGDKLLPAGLVGPVQVECFMITQMQ